MKTPSSQGPLIEEPADNPELAAFKVAEGLIKSCPPKSGKRILLKPNIVNPSPPPVTTDYRVVKGVVSALRKSGYDDIVIAEGSGTGSTLDNLQSLGYGEIEAELLDLDEQPYSTVDVNDFEVWESIFLPEILKDCHIVSIPVLKDHTMLGVTIGLKNMVGVLPASKYSGYWTYKKSQIHRHRPHGCVSDIIRVARPDWTVVDATVGMRESHIAGIPMVPPANMVFGSCDSLEADKYGASILGHNWKDIEYLKKIDTFWKPSRS